MPLCPQITNTPITVTQTADFTVSSVVPAVADTSDGIATNFAENTGNQVYRQPTAPTSPPFTLKIGDLWFDTDDGNKEYYWDGTNWISVQDGSIATKNRTYYSATAPTGSDLTIGDIWFDTSTGNKPYRWNGTTWISVQDASIATALSAANAAQSTADGKNKVIYSLSTPSGSGTASGDIWWQYNASGIIIGQWEWSGSSWVPKTIGSAVIANLDAGKITAGTISVAISLEAATITGGSININSGTFVVTTGGAVTITSGSFNINSGTFQVSTTGAITATSGSIGGWSLSSTSISKTVSTRTTTLNASDGLISIYDSNTGFLAGGAISVGTPSITTSFSSAGFSFGSDAVIDVRNELGSYSGTLRIYAPSNKGIRLVPNAGTTSGTYLVTVEGSLSVFGNILSPTISGNITSTGSLSTGSGTFVVNSSGAITAVTTITASGLITAQNGVTVSGAPVYTGTPTATPTNSTEGTALTNGGTVIGRRSNDTPLMLHIFNVTATTGTSVPIVQFYRNATARGTLEVYGNTVAPVLVGSSDYRLKENIRDYDDALNKVLSARVRVFNEIEDETKNDIVGFVAHEFAEVFPNFVSGEKDAVDENGQPVYQKLGYGNMIPYLVGAIQELHKEITLLKGE